MIQERRRGRDGVQVVPAERGICKGFLSSPATQVIAITQLLLFKFPSRTLSLSTYQSLSVSHSSACPRVLSPILFSTHPLCSSLQPYPLFLPILAYLHNLLFKANVAGTPRLLPLTHITLLYLGILLFISSFIHRINLYRYSSSLLLTPLCIHFNAPYISLEKNGSSYTRKKVHNFRCPHQHLKTFTIRQVI